LSGLILASELLFWHYFDSFQTAVVLQASVRNQQCCPFVLDHPIVNSYFRYQSNTRVFDKILYQVFEQWKARFAQP